VEGVGDKGWEEERYEERSSNLKVFMCRCPRLSANIMESIKEGETVVHLQ
jgi:hypothetical protein